MWLCLAIDKNQKPYMFTSVPKNKEDYIYLEELWFPMVLEDTENLKKFYEEISKISEISYEIIYGDKNG